MKNKIKFEITFNLDTDEGYKLDKHSIKSFELALYDWVNNYSGYLGYFYAYSKNDDGEAIPTKLKVKKVAVS